MSAADTLEGDILRRGEVIADSASHAIIVSLDVDVVRWTPGDLEPTNSEAISNVVAMSESQTVMRLVEPVYIRDGDVALYQPSQEETIPTRRLQYDH